MADNTAAGIAAALAEKPEAGKTTIDEKMRFGPLHLAYASARDLAYSIGITIADKTKDDTVVVAGTQLLADYANLQAALLTLDGLKKDYELLQKFAKELKGKTRGFVAEAAADANLRAKAPGQPAPAAPVLEAAAAAAAANPFVAAALGALSLLQSDVEFHGTETKIDRLTFELAVAGTLKKFETKKVLIPDLVLAPLQIPKSSVFRTALDAVAEAKSKAWLEIAPFIKRALDAEAELDKAAQEKDAVKKAAAVDSAQAELDTARRNLEPLNTPLMRADQALEDLQEGWRKVEAGEVLSTLARMLRVESIATTKVDGKLPIYLHCAVVDSGGHHRIHRSLLRMLFFGDGLSFAGGAIVRWALLDSDGSIRQSGMVSTELKQ
jgi:hypothetical protein